MSVSVSTKNDMFGKLKSGIDSLNISTTRNLNTVLGLGGPMYHSGQKNAFVGYSTSAKGATAGNLNAFLGAEAGLNNVASCSTFIGSCAGYWNVSGEENVFLGTWAGGFNSNGSRNTLIGSYAGYRVMGNDNIFVGYSNGLSYTKPCSNIIAIGSTIDARNKDHIVIGHATKLTGDRSIILGSDVHDTGSENIIFANKCATRNTGCNNFIVMTPSDGVYNNNTYMNDMVNIKNRFISKRSSGGTITTSLSGDIIDLNAKSALNMSGTTNFQGMVSFTSDFNVAAASTFSGPVRMDSDAAIFGELTVNILKVTSNTDLLGDLSVMGQTLHSGTIHGLSNLVIDNNAVISGSVQISGPTSLGSSLDVTGSASIGGGLDVTGTLHALSNAVVDQSLSIGQTLNVSGPTSLGSSLDVVGVLDIGETLNVTGSASIGGGLDVTGTLHALSNAVIEESLSVVGSLDVQSYVHCHDDIVIDGSVMIGGMLDVNSTIHGCSNLIIDGTAFIGANAHISGGLSVSSNMSFENGELIVNSSATFLGDTVRIKRLIVDNLEALIFNGGSYSNSCSNYGGGSNNVGCTGGSGVNFEFSRLSNCTLIGCSVEGPTNISGAVTIGGIVEFQNDVKFNGATINVNSSNIVISPDATTIVSGGILKLMTSHVHLSNISTTIDSQTILFPSEDRDANYIVNSKPLDISGDLRVQGDFRVNGDLNVDGRIRLSELVGFSNNHIDILGSVDMLTGPVHIRDLVVDKITLSGYSNEHCTCPDITLPPTFPSDSNGSVDEILGDLIVDGFVCAKKGFCGPAHFFCGLTVYCGLTTFMDTVRIKNLEVEALTLVDQYLPPPGTLGGHIDQFHGDIVIDGNVYIKGGVAIGGNSNSLTAYSTSPQHEAMLQSLTVGHEINIGEYTIRQEVDDSKKTLVVDNTLNSETTTLPLEDYYDKDPGNFIKCIKTPQRQDESDELETPGTLVIATSVIPNTTMPVIVPSSMCRDVRVLGVIAQVTINDDLRLGPLCFKSKYQTTSELLTTALVQVRGLGRIRVSMENGPIANGDLLTSSSIPGVAMRQGDDVVKSCTVAKSLSNVVASVDISFIHDLPCIFLLG